MATPSEPAAGMTRTGVLLQAVAVGVTLIWAWALIVAYQDHHAREFTSRYECGTDPRDFLRAGELLDGTSLRFIVESHCANVRYPSDERIELRYGGFEIPVETTRLSIGGAPYYKIVSVGGDESP